MSPQCWLEDDPIAHKLCGVRRGRGGEAPSADGSVGHHSASRGNSRSRRCTAPGGERTLRKKERTVRREGFPFQSETALFSGEGFRPVREAASVPGEGASGRGEGVSFASEGVSFVGKPLSMRALWKNGAFDPLLHAKLG